MQKGSPDIISSKSEHWAFVELSIALFAWLLMSVLGSAGCSDPGAETNDDVSDTDSSTQKRLLQPSPPSIRPSTESLTFHLTSSQEAEHPPEKKIELVNTGELPLKIFSVALKNGNSCNFRITVPSQKAILPVPEKIFQIAVKFTPGKTGTFSDELVIRSDSIPNETIKIDLKGYADITVDKKMPCTEADVSVQNTFCDPDANYASNNASNSASNSASNDASNDAFDTDAFDTDDTFIDVSGERSYRTYVQSGDNQIQEAEMQMTIEQSGNLVDGIITGKVANLGMELTVWVYGTVYGNTVCALGVFPDEDCPCYFEGTIEFDDVLNMNMDLIGTSCMPGGLDGSEPVTGIRYDEDEYDVCVDGLDNDSDGAADCVDEDCAGLAICDTSGQ